jgi:outer membrane protein OmpA-like peptidoglycan-associated protein
MKKQVLSFNEFIFEAYRVYEAEEEGAMGPFGEAIKLMKDSGASSDAMAKIGDIVGITNMVANTDNTKPLDRVGVELKQLMTNLSNSKIKISKTISSVNVIKYGNVVGNQVLLEGGDRVHILDFLYELNLNNANDKSSLGAKEEGKGRKKKVLWNKVQTDKRWASMSDMQTYRGMGKLKNAGGRWAQFFNFVASFFERDNRVSDEKKDTKYLYNSGLLNNIVITDISNGVIKTEQSIITARDMFLGGRSSSGKRNPKGFSNVEGDKGVVSGYTLAIPYKSTLTEEQTNPTKGKANINKTPKGYFTIVLYSMGEIAKSTDTIPFSDLEKQEKLIPQDDVSVEYICDLDTNDSGGKQVLFAQNGYTLSEVGKNNIDLLIEQFYSIKSIQVQGFASDEGTVDVNTALCKNRSKEVTKYLKGVTEWNLGSRVTDSASVNIQPKQLDSLTAAQKEEARKPYRKVRLLINGTKVKNDPKEPTTEIKMVPTVGSFNTDTVDINQIILTFEVEANKTTRKGK